MRLFKEFVGYKIVFPFLGRVAEGTLTAVERTGYLLIRNVSVDDTSAGDLIIPTPDWVRRIHE